VEPGFFKGGDKGRCLTNQKILGCLEGRGAIPFFFWLGLEGTNTSQKKKKKPTPYYGTFRKILAFDWKFKILTS